jgi:hypothetical protein
MKGSILVLMGVALGCAAGAVGFAPSRSVGQTRSAAVEQYCTDTGDYNNISELDRMVRAAGNDGFELIGVYRPNSLGATYHDYVCFRRAR